jgi:hypothetical protein
MVPIFADSGAANKLFATDFRAGATNGEHPAGRVTAERHETFAAVARLSK